MRDTVHVPMELTDRLEEALAYAFEIHGDQERKVHGEPYMSHLLGVTALVLEHGGDETETIAALLHDAVEESDDGKARLAEIRDRFGDDVADIVEDCSDCYGEPKPKWTPRKTGYIETLRTTDRVGSLRVVAADKTHNGTALAEDLRREGDAVLDNFNGGREGTLWYYATVATTLGGRVDDVDDEGLERLVSRLEHIVEEILEAVGVEASVAQASKWYGPP